MSLKIWNHIRSIPGSSGASRSSRKSPQMTEISGMTQRLPCWHEISLFHNLHLLSEYHVWASRRIRGLFSRCYPQNWVLLCHAGSQSSHQTIFLMCQKDRRMVFSDMWKWTGGYHMRDVEHCTVPKRFWIEHVLVMIGEKFSHLCLKV